MAKGFEVDFVGQTITIVDASAVDADGAKEIAALQQAGYKTVNARKQSRRGSTSKGKGKAYYRDQLTEAQRKEFDAILTDNGFFSAKAYAIKQGAK